MQRAGVRHGQMGVLGSTMGTLCVASGQFVILLPPWAVVCWQSCKAAAGVGQAPLPLCMKPPCAPGHLPALGEGSPCLAAEQPSPSSELSSTLPAQNNPLQKSHGTAFMLCHIFGTYGFK